MGYVTGMTAHKRCRKCGEKIFFMPRPGFIPAGKPKYYPANVDDRQPHWKRCRLTLELRAARRSESHPNPGSPAKQQGSRRRRKPSSLETAQRDLFHATTP